MQSDIPVLIAAAGIGSRLGMNMPKVLVEVNGRSLLDRLLRDVLVDETDVRLIVGFRADEVIAAARAVRDDVIIVRNPNFRDTSVRHSFWLAARHLDADCIIVDGDTLIDPASYRAFRRAAQLAPSLIGVARATTTDAVFAHTDTGPTWVRRFDRTQGAPHEWCGVAKLPAALFDQPHQYVFECIAPMLPAPAFRVDCAEVDTQEDLAKAEDFARQIDAVASLAFPRGPARVDLLVAKVGAEASLLAA